MTPVQIAARASAIAAGQAAASAGAQAAIAAVSTAAQNAAKSGASSSEFKATIGGVVTVGILAALQVLSVLPGPWMLPALALSAAITVGSYAISRGTVKKAALTAAGATVQATSGALAVATLAAEIALKPATTTTPGTTTLFPPSLP